MEKRGTHLVFVHCILNMNTRAPGISVWSGAVIPILNITLNSSLEFSQLPCMETAYLGVRRWWFVREQYNNAVFRELCSKILKAYADSLFKNGISEVLVVGAGLSPTCGYRETQSNPLWGGRPREVDTSGNVAVGSGVLMSIAQKVFVSHGLNVRFYDVSPALIYPGGRVESTRTYPRDPLRSVYEFCLELSDFNCIFNYSIRKLLELRRVNRDLRSYRTLVLPEDVACRRSVLLKHALEGYGLAVVNELCCRRDLKSYFEKTYYNQLVNQATGGHKVVFYCRGCGGESYCRVLKLFSRVRRPVFLEN